MQSNNNLPTPLGEAWQKIYAADLERHDHRLAPGAPRFVDYAWRSFNPKTLIKILISNEPTYPALKLILFSGLCTWVVCPDREGLRKHAMLLVGIEHLRAAETQGRRMFATSELPGHELLGDIIGRIRFLGQDFFSDFYYPIGGIAQVLRSTTPANFKRSLERRSAEIPSVVALMQVYHHHALHLAHSEKYHKASLNKGSLLVKEIFRELRGEEGGVAQDNVNDRWQRSAETAALAYAAATIELEPGVSLLSAIRDGTAHYNQCGVHLEEWIGRARYAVKHILALLHKTSFAKMNRASLPPGEIRPIPPPAFSVDEQLLIKKTFRK